MSRRALELGEHGEIKATPQKLIDGKWTAHPSGRGADRWRARAYYCGHDGVKGESSCVAKSKVLAVKAVEAALSQVLSAGDGGQTATTPLVKAGKAWLVQIARTDSGLSARTQTDYAATFKRYIDANGSTIRGLTLGQANDPQRLRGFLQTVADNHGTASAKIAKSVLSSIIGQAVNDGVLTMNAVRQVRPVKSQTLKAETERKTDKAFTKAERDAVVAYADALASEELEDVALRQGFASKQRKRQTAADLIAFMAGTGVRVTEARSLRWEHVDLAKGTVEIHGTKSEKSKRLLSLPSWLIERLHQRMSTGKTYGYVFSSPHLMDQEAIWDQSNSAKALSDVLKGAGFPWATPHALRRTVASLLHEAGVTPVKIADQLGHADPSMTMRVYLGRDFMGDKATQAQYL